MSKLFILISLALLTAGAASCAKNSPDGDKTPPVSEAGSKPTGNEVIDLSNSATIREFESENVEITTDSLPETPDPLLLLVTADREGNLKLNSEYAGKISEPKRIQGMLAETFDLREKEGIYGKGEPKSVLVGLPARVNRGDFERLVQAINDAGAESLKIFVLK